MEKLLIPYSEAIDLIQEGDVLLFRGQGMISKLIGSMTETPYSHVGIASWANGKLGIWECVEFREGSWIASLFNKNAGGGGRSINLAHAVESNPEQIDIYRPIKDFDKVIFNAKTKKTKNLRKVFSGKKVTRTMKKMTGLPYGWKRIWWMTKHKLVFLRLFKKETIIHDNLEDVVYPVCSTAVAYAFNSNGYDLVHNRSDQWTEPGDIAKSPRLNYLFTLQ